MKFGFGRLCFLLLMFALLPGFARAQVVISEIMYDYPGSEESGKHDWVEVFNSGTSAVSLSEWRLRENDSDHQINPYPDSASATLPTGAYAVIANDAGAFKIDFPAYTGLLFDSSFSLVSGGETLVLRCCGSSVADRTDRDTVSYTPVDSATDQGNTLGRTNVSGTVFVSASPSPGTGPLSSSASVDASPGPETSGATNSDQGADAGNTSGDSIMPPPPKLFVDGGSDRTVVVGADTEFRARAYDEKKNVIDFVRFHWNFGDGTTADTATAMHRFEYPGRYVIVLAMPEQKDAVADQIIVTVERVALALSLMEDGGVMIENRAGRTLDLSRWIVRSTGRTFTIPEQTFILAGSSLRISPKTLGFSGGADVELAYPNGELALGVAPTPVAAAASSTPTSVPAKYSSRTAVFEKAQDYAAVRESESFPVEQSDIATTEETVPAQAAGAAAALSGASPIWWLGVVGVAGLAAGSLALARRYGKKEWDIIEETGETR